MANTKITSNVISDDINLGGNPTTTTQSAGNNTTRIATTAFVKAAIDATIDSAPGALDTLNELAAAIGDDANFSTTITNSIATKLPLAGGTLTGGLTGTSATFTDDVAINNGSPELYFGTTGNHYNWRIAAQENTDGALQIDVGSQDTDYSNDSYSSVFTVKNTGNVGIGTTSPDHLLEIETTSSSVAPNLGFRNTQAGAQIGMPANVNALAFFTGDNERMRILSDGKVGLGTGAPAYTLHVEGAGSIAGLISRSGSGTNSFENAMIIDAKTSNDAADGYGPALYFTFTDSGVTRSEIANISVIRDGADNSGQMQFGVRNAGTWDYDAMVIDSTSKVGIGTASPDSLLHVDGSIDGPLVTIHQTGGASSNYRGLDVETSSTGTSVQRWFNAGTELMSVGGSGAVNIKGGNLYLTGTNDRRIKLSDSGIAGVSDSNNTVHIRGDNDFMKLNAAGNGGFIFEENGSERMRIASGGAVTMSGGAVTMSQQPGFFARGNTSQWLQGYSSAAWSTLVGGIAHSNGSTIGVNLTEGATGHLNGYDAQGDFNTSNGRFTAPNDGKYLIHGSMYCAKTSSAAGDYIHFLVYVNGQQINQMYTIGGHGISSNTDFSLNLSTILKLDEDDYVEWKVYTTSTSTRIYGDHLCIGAHMIS